jgi:hypothetical protein
MKYALVFKRSVDKHKWNEIFSNHGSYDSARRAVTRSGYCKTLDIWDRATQEKLPLLAQDRSKKPYALVFVSRVTGVERGELFSTHRTEELAKLARSQSGYSKLLMIRRDPTGKFQLIARRKIEYYDQLDVFGEYQTVEAASIAKSNSGYSKFLTVYDSMELVPIEVRAPEGLRIDYRTIRRIGIVKSRITRLTKKMRTCNTLAEHIDLHRRITLLEKRLGELQ